MTDHTHRQEARIRLLLDHLQQPDGGARRHRRSRTRLALLPAVPVPIRGDPGGSAVYEWPHAPLIAVPARNASQAAAIGKARAVREVTGAAHGDQQRTVALELSHWISLAGESIVDLGGELDIVSAEVAVRYVRNIVDRRRRPVIADLAALSFCDARGLAALVQMAGYAEQMGCTFRLASPRPSLVKIMRITGLDRRFLAVQVPEQAAGLRLP
jgi:anti-sigma B factor antagonist